MFGKKNNITRFRYFDNDSNKFKAFFPVEGAEICSGFVDYFTKEYEGSTITPSYSYPNGKEILALKLRIDKRSVPGTLLNKEFEKQLKKIIKQNETIDEYSGEVVEYKPSKDMKRELKNAIKNKLLKDMPAIPKYLDVYINKTDGYGYISSTSKKDIEELENLIIDNFEEYPITEKLDETDFHHFAVDVWDNRNKEKYLISVGNDNKLIDANGEGKVQFAGVDDESMVDNLLEKVYSFSEVEFVMKNYDASFKMKNFDCVYGFVDEAMVVEEDEQSEEVEQRMIALDALFKVVGDSVNIFVGE